MSCKACQAVDREQVENRGQDRARSPGAHAGPPRYGLDFVDRNVGAGRIQLKPQIGAANDPLEREADRLADAVMSGGFAGTISRAAPGSIHRKCAACEEETIRRDPAGPVAADGSAEGAAQAVARGGTPLPPSARSFFSAGFGRDLSKVRIHSDSRAGEAALGIGARAYTLGNDIAFAPGEYAPDRPYGRRLLAHELAHVLQQRDGTPVIRRATYGVGTLPVRNWIAPPANERAHVNEAIAKVDAVVADPATYRECHEQYASRCPGGAQGTLATIWNRARIWRKPGIDPGAYAWAPENGSDIAYTSLGYAQNATDLAATLMHEAGHNCGIRGNDTHWHAELVSNYCMTPGQNSFSLSGGPSLSGGEASFLMSYRRFLGDWAGGRLRGTLGADFNFAGVLSEAAYYGPASERPAHEFGSVMGGLQYRAGGWGGTRYGGISFRLETGLGAGRFTTPPATSGAEPTTGIMPNVVLQVGPRAEFLIKTGDAHVTALSIGAAYRLVQPLNAEARALHGALLSAELNF